MFSLCQKIENWDSGIKKDNATITKAPKEKKQALKPSVLRPFLYNVTTDSERVVVCLTTGKPAKAARNEELRKKDGYDDKDGDRWEEVDDWPCDIL